MQPFRSTSKPRAATMLRSITAVPSAEPARSREILRAGLLGLAAVTTVGVGADLAVERHWSQPVQLIAWAALAVMAVAIALLVGAPRRRTVHVARAAAALVMLASVTGVFEHVATNYAAGPFDVQYAGIWANLPEMTRWWLAISKSIGVAPPFAPGALAEAAMSLLLATIGHPALDARRRQLRPMKSSGGDSRTLAEPAGAADSALPWAR